jgi:hypothetical protein
MSILKVWRTIGIVIILQNGMFIFALHLGNILCFSKISMLLNFSFYIAWIILSKDMALIVWIANETCELCIQKHWTMKNVTFD